jgi:hypothetical protein
VLKTAVRANGFHVGSNRGEEDVIESFDRLEFDDNLTGDEQVQAVLADG